jgi:hypothetical protein
MPIFKAILTVEGSNETSSVSVIEYDGKFWLVPQWLENRTAGWRKPERLIFLSDLAHQILPESSSRGHFLVSAPVPTSVLYGPAQQAVDTGYRVIHRPEIQFPIPLGID